MGAVERFSALNDHAVVRAFQGNTHRGEFVYHDIKTVRFFDFQLLRIPDHGCTVRCGGKNRDDRDFIDQGRDQFALDDSAGKTDLELFAAWNRNAGTAGRNGWDGRKNRVKAKKWIVRK